MRTVHRAVMTLLPIIGMLAFAFNVQSSKSEVRTWIVDDNGPGDFHTIQEAINAANTGDTIYTKAGTYYEHITVNKTLTLKGEGPHLTTIDGNGTGVVVRITANSTIFSNFTVRNGGGFTLQEFLGGILIGGSYENEVQNCTIQNTVLTNNGLGMILYLCSNTTLRNNYLSDNRFNFMVYGSNVLSYFIHDIDTSNLVNGKPIYYLINQQNLTIDPNAYQNIGYLALVNCTHMIVENLTLQGNSEGLLVAYTGDTRIVNNYITNSLYGILGIDLYGNTLSGNNITGNLVGISITGWWNTLFNNNITNNTSPEFGGVGVLFNTFSEDNAMVGNDIGSNGVGVYLFSSDNNTFYHNNFVNNTEQAVSTDELGPPPNDWNEEYPWGGNYWSNYNGTDLHRGPFQNETGPDGIGDTYYPMNQNNSDRYPLMKPWTMPEHDLHLSDVYIERSVSYYLPTTHVYAGQIVGIVTLLRNEGKATETFNVTCDCDGSMISTLSVSNFTSGDFRFLEFTWNTTGLAPCRNHTISAEAEPVAEETMPGNNKMTMLVEVNLMGDINGDGSVNIIDIARIAKSFGKPAYYDPDCDLNLDDEINIVDIAMAARYFGRTCG